MIFPPPRGQLEAMREGGKRLGAILAQLLSAATPGTSLVELDALAQKKIVEAGGAPSFQTVQGYRWATCLCVNDVVVHGVPSPYTIQEGDVLTVDVGMLFQGFHTDAAWTKIVGKQKTESRKQKEKFLRLGEEALRMAIAQARKDKHVGHISLAIQEHIEDARYSVVKSLVGHGVGRQLHESPQIPGFIRGKIERTPKLRAGTTIAIEVIYAMGKGKVTLDSSDGWSVVTRDGSLSAVFEHTIAVTAADPIVLTSFKK